MNNSAGQPLFVFALEDESQGLFDRHDVIYTGVGKVNASYALMKAVHMRRPSIVVNLGTAGSQIHKAGHLVNCHAFVQRDMDVRPLGFEHGQTPFSDIPVRLEYGRRIDGVTAGTCGTGDNFAIDDSASRYDVVDMEAYALALLCHKENLPFLCLKYVSDGADGAAAADWPSALKAAAAALRKTIDGVEL